MKILISANTDWYLYNFRRSLMVYLRNAGHEVVLVSPPGVYAARIQALGFRWLPWHLGRKTLAPWKELAAIRELVQIYRREQPDLVHHHTIKPSLYGTFAGRLARVPGIVNSITGRGFVFLGEKLWVRLLRWGVKWLYRLAFSPDNCLAIFENRSDQDYFIQEKLIAAEKTFLIPGVGVDAQRFLPTPEPAGTPIVLFASRMLWDKGVGVVVEAARLLQNRVQARFVLVGRPDPGNPASIPEATLQAWHAEGIIEYWGFRDEMAEIYQQAAIVTLPTMYAEGIPTVLLEAAASGRPVVASQMPGCEDLIVADVTGYLVPTNDAASLANALEKLIASPLLRGKMGRAARERILASFEVQKINAATVRAFNKLKI